MDKIVSRKRRNCSLSTQTYPIGTIAVSIIVAMILWGVLCFVLFMVFGALLAGAGIAAGAAAR